MSNADKRKISTDALETLGTIIGPHEKRDAIHLAVIPIMAPDEISPGQHVDREGYLTNKYSERAVGIVDPFLKNPVNAGEWFWVVLYPRQITSLRHVWSHPAFPEEDKLTLNVGTGNGDIGFSELSEFEKSEKWIKLYAEELGVNVKDLLDGADNFINSNGREYYLGEPNNYGMYPYFEGLGTNLYFWDHYEIIRGVKINPELKHNFFSYSC